MREGKKENRVGLREDENGWGEGGKSRGIDVESPWERAAVEARLDLDEALTCCDPRGYVWCAILKIKQATSSLFTSAPPERRQK